MWFKTRQELLAFQKQERLIPNALAGPPVLNRAEELAELQLINLGSSKKAADLHFPDWNAFNDHFKIPARGFNYRTAQRLNLLSRFGSSLSSRDGLINAIEHPAEDLTVKKDPYSETFLRSPNQSGRITPKFIVLHDSFGSFAGGVSWIRQALSRVSYHYLINTDGHRTQFVWDSRRAWHAGTSRWAGFVGLNAHSIGLALSGNTANRYATDQEIDSLAWKCLYLLDKFGLQRSAIVTHAMISPGRKIDTSETTYRRVLERVEQIQKSLRN